MFPEPLHLLFNPFPAGQVPDQVQACADGDGQAGQEHPRPFVAAEPDQKVAAEDEESLRTLDAHLDQRFVMPVIAAVADAGHHDFGNEQHEGGEHEDCKAHVQVHRGEIAACEDDLAERQGPDVEAAVVAFLQLALNDVDDACHDGEQPESLHAQVEGGAEDQHVVADVVPRTGRPVEHAHDEEHPQECHDAVRIDPQPGFGEKGQEGGQDGAPTAVRIRVGFLGDEVGEEEPGRVSHAVEQDAAGPRMGHLPEGQQDDGGNERPHHGEPVEAVVEIEWPP